MATGTFATTINCMDGRVQEPVADWLRRELHVDFVDTITEPGPDKLLAGGYADTCASIKQRLAISVRAHGSQTVAIVAHHDCAGNPVPQSKHLEQLAEAARRVARWGLGIRILTLWVDEAWNVELVHDSQAPTT